MIGWRIEGQFPDLPQLVVVMAPHSSNWDFIHAISVLFSLRLSMSIIGKHTLFVGPMGSFMRWLGAIPVDRSHPENLIERVAQIIKDSPRLWLGVAPEGTRRAGVTWKSGFYRIAMAAQVPILPVYIDYRQRVIGILPVIIADAPVDEGVARVRALINARGCRRDARRQPAN